MSPVCGCSVKETSARKRGLFSNLVCMIHLIYLISKVPSLAPKFVTHVTSHFVIITVALCNT